MTRKKEIEQAADEHFAHSWCGSVKDAFAEGAQWADRHPRGNLVDIDKVCKFIDNKTYSYIESDALGVCVNTDMLISDLRKAMKGE